MNSCQTCGHSPCTCAPAVLSGIQLVNSLLSNPTIDGMTANGGTANNLALVGAQIDCTSRGCTAGAGVCNDGIATNAQVCAVVDAAISSSNAAFCAAVGDCIAGDPTILCPTVAACINSTPGIINNTSAFGFNARATTALYGVTRYATGLELQNGSCLVAIDPCTLIANWNTPALGSAFWTAFTSAVATVLGDPAACTALAPCGFAPLASPAFTGVPTGPTAAPGTNNTQLATTAFVNASITAAINASNPNFCSAVTTCGGGGGGGGGAGSGGCTGTAFAAGSYNFEAGATIYAAGCTIDGAGNVTFTTPRANTNYSIVIGTQGGDANPPFPVPDAQWNGKTTNGFHLTALYSSALAPMVVDFAVFEDVCVPGVSGPGNFASFTVLGTDGSIGVSITGIVANYGCSVGPGTGGFDITFTTPQPNTRWTVHTQGVYTGGALFNTVPLGPLDWIAAGTMFGTPGISVNGYHNFGISNPPAVNGNDAPSTVEWTFVCSR